MNNTAIDPTFPGFMLLIGIVLLACAIGLAYVLIRQYRKDRSTRPVAGVSTPAASRDLHTALSQLLGERLPNDERQLIQRVDEIHNKLAKDLQDMRDDDKTGTVDSDVINKNAAGILVTNMFHYTPYMKARHLKHVEMYNDVNGRLLKAEGRVALLEKSIDKSLETRLKIIGHVDDVAVKVAKGRGTPGALEHAKLQGQADTMERFMPIVLGELPKVVEANRSASPKKVAKSKAPANGKKPKDKDPDEGDKDQRPST